MKSFEKVKFKGVFRDYQKRVLDNSDTYLLNGKINIVAAPGSGKTILGLELIRKLNAPTIILSPTTTIKYQWGARFANNFLDATEDVNDYFSYDLHEITLINSITYQALHSVMNKLSVEEDGELIDYSDVDIFELVKKYGVKTICLDEAHHLQNEWQKSLDKFIEQIGENVKIVALTATPPYDAGKVEWERYEKICGPIDEEIFVPELVKEGTLCPHQDYVYFNYPTRDEVSFQEYKNDIISGIRELRELPIYNKIRDSLDWKSVYDVEPLFEYTKEYLSLFILLNSMDIHINEKIIKILTGGKTTLPKLTFGYCERAYQFLLDNKEILSEEERSDILKILKKYSIIEKGEICFTLKEITKHKLVSSVGKLNSIAKITMEESKNLGDSLRLLILTDYIKKESIKNLSSDKTATEISVVTIFECLLKSNPTYKMGVLSGNLIILPTECKQYLKGQNIKRTQIGDTIYSEFSFSSMKNKDIVNIVSDLFEKGIINIIIGTKALLGEGWDSPCINTLILASFVGSFMLSNQMRGRAIRIDKNNPNKTANIWHLVTLEPDYIFEEKLFDSLMMERRTDYSVITSYDYEILERRFECFVGPNYSTGEIESGIERLTVIHPPYNKNGIEDINKEMLLRAQKRNDSYSQWDNAVKSKINLTEEMIVPKEKVVSPLRYINYLGLVAAATIQGLITTVVSVLGHSLSQNVGENPDILYVLLAVLVGCWIFDAFVLCRVLKKVISHYSPKKNMLYIAKALLKTFQDLGTIGYKTSVKVDGDDEVICIYLSEGATALEQNIFNTAVNEMFSPIDNPRYILVFARRGVPDYSRSYSCPTVLGQKKETVDMFTKRLSERIGDFLIIYTRNEEGRKKLLKIRNKAFINRNDPAVKKKKKLRVYE